MDSWDLLMSELREVLWLASVVGGLSVLGVGAGVGLAFLFGHWGVPFAAHA